MGLFLELGPGFPLRAPCRTSRHSSGDLACQPQGADKHLSTQAQNVNAMPTVPLTMSDSWQHYGEWQGLGLSQRQAPLLAAGGVCQCRSVFRVGLRQGVKRVHLVGLLYHRLCPVLGGYQQESWLCCLLSDLGWEEVEARAESLGRRPGECGRAGRVPMGKWLQPKSSPADLKLRAQRPSPRP